MTSSLSCRIPQSPRVDPRVWSGVNRHEKRLDRKPSDGLMVPFVEEPWSGPRSRSTSVKNWIPMMWVMTSSSPYIGVMRNLFINGVPSFLKFKSSPLNSIPSSRHLLISETTVESTSGCLLFAYGPLHCKNRLQTNAQVRG